MTTETKEDIWFEKFSPVINPNGQGGYSVGDHQYMFDTVGQDLKRVQKALEANYDSIWTLIEGDDGNQYIVAGFHFINRMGYFITEKPAETGDEEYLFFTEEELDN